MNAMNKIKCICEVCGRTEILTPEEAYQQGWDYPPYMGTFGVVSARTCPDCVITDTAWAALVLEKKPLWELSERQLEAVRRIIDEPESLIPDEV
jgi:hypothetical protein